MPDSATQPAASFTPPGRSTTGDLPLPPRPAARHTTAIFALAFVILLLTAALRVYDLGGRDLWVDEANGVLMAQEDLPGSRRAIAKGVESKVDALDNKVEALTTLLQGFIERVTRKREG